MRLALRLALIVVACSVLLAVHTPPEEEAHPPHALPPVSAVQQPGTQPDWLTAVADARWVSERETERLEHERAAENERMEAARRAPSVGVVGGGDCETLAREFGVVVDVVQRESRCSRDAGLLNASGCEGFGCIGPVQLHLGHFANPSPWGGVGACWGLNPYSYADQVECAHRLGPSAWG